MPVYQFITTTTRVTRQTVWVEARDSESAQQILDEGTKNLTIYREDEIEDGVSQSHEPVGRVGLLPAKPVKRGRTSAY